MPEPSECPSMIVNVSMCVREGLAMIVLLDVD